MAADPRQKAKDLIALAVGKTTPEKERISAALKAVAIIHNNDLLKSGSTIDEIMASVDSETVQAATNIYKTFTNPDLVNNVKMVARQFAKRQRSRR